MASPDYSHVLVLTGIPKDVDTTKQPKLRDLILRLLRLESSDGRSAPLVPDNFELALSSGNDPRTLGHAFAEYSSALDASRVLTSKRKFPIDKRHTVQLVRLSDTDRIIATPSDYEEPDLASLTDKFSAARDRYDWLLEGDGDDFVLVREKVPSSLCIFKPTTVEKMHPVWQKRVCEAAELESAWSTGGTYLFTFFHAGFEVRAGEDMRILYRRDFPGIVKVASSPQEKFWVTFRQSPPQMDVWDALRGVQLYSRKGDLPPPLPTSAPWPQLKFSHDEKYVAFAPEVKLSGDRTGRPLEVLSTSSWSSVATKSNAAVATAGAVAAGGLPSDVCGFEWSPRHDLLAYWAAEHGNTPACVCVLKPHEEVAGTPDRAPVVRFERVAQKQLFLLRSMSLHWAEDAPVLVCTANRDRKTTVDGTLVSGPRLAKTSHVARVQVSGLEIIRLGGRKGQPAAPVETISVDGQVTNLSWALTGCRFSVAIEQPSGEHKVLLLDAVSAEDPRATTRTVASMMYPRPLVMAWSPVDSYFVMTVPPPNSRTPPEGHFLFCRVTEKKAKKTKSGTAAGGMTATIEVLKEVTHPYAGGYSWSPSGRWFSTWVGCQATSMSNGVRVFDVFGEQVHKQDREVFWFWLWRPRPPSLLTKDQKRTLEKAVPELLAQWREEHGGSTDVALAARRDMVQTLREWRLWRSEFTSRVDKWKLARRAERGYESEEELEEVVEVVVEN
eukprot:TRINITY_DN32921_c0_g1_i1.p1 TRINITY_DN32921_c0_g1~~TRINITY_DN32921_c0_g1_i1.p1  ORF type:complete len:724 (-),score=195.88 TRINITY_DN32921_c0_g1_i1:562-2733(-)